VTRARSGLLVVDKPAGVTSHDVVARVRRWTRTRKVGHAGTLDPMATGVLLLGVGRATRLLGHLTLAEKTYEATVRLGLSTTTDDAEGDPLVRVPAGAVDETQVRQALGAMIGDLDQVPATVSAVKVDGRRSYERARAGEQVELQPRRVRIHELTVHDVRSATGATGGLVDVDLTVRCSSGTYVRSIARDVGAVLGVGGHLTRLRRTAIGTPDRGLTLADAVALPETVEGADVPLLPMGDVARRFFACVTVGADAARAVGHGRRLDLEPESAGAEPVAVLDEGGALLALYRLDLSRPDGSHAPLAVLV
jgi:tRNA pseudouridine55 synthase